MRNLWTTNAPVATPSALSGMHAAITRTSDNWNRRVASALCADDRRGSIKVGKQADLVILDQDPIKIGHERPDDLLKINVIETDIDGKNVFDHQ